MFNRIKNSPYCFPLILLILGFLFFPLKGVDPSPGLEIGLVTSMRALSLSQAIGFISTIPMGLGARETAAMTYFGNENSLIFMGLLLSRLLTLFYILLGFCFYMSHPAGVKQRPDIK